MPLERLERRQFMSKVRSTLLDRLSQGGRRTHQEVFGRPMGAATTVMSSRGPTAAESTAFEERKKNRALYGKYGKGGLERERLGSAEKIAGMEDVGKTARERIKAGSALDVEGRRQKGATGRFKREQDRLGQKDAWRYRPPGDPFNPQQGLEWDKIGAFRGRTEAWRRQGVKPQFIPGDPDLETGDRMFGLNPRTGRYDISEVPTRKKKKTWKDYDY